MENNPQMRKKANPVIARSRPISHMSIGGHPLPGLGAAFAVVTQTRPSIGREIKHPKLQRQDITPTWTGELVDQDIIHPAAAASRVPITAGGVTGGAIKANAFRTLGDHFGGRG